MYRIGKESCDFRLSRIDLKNDYKSSDAFIPLSSCDPMTPRDKAGIQDFDNSTPSLINFLRQSEWDIDPVHVASLAQLVSEYVRIQRTVANDSRISSPSLSTY